MGVLEKRARQARIWGTFQLSLLGIAALGGILLVAASMPNAGYLLKHLPGYTKGARFNYQAKSALSRLIQSGHMVLVEKNGKRYAQLTDKGRSALALNVALIGTRKKRRWDGQWRVVIFDIPESRKNTRARLRRFMERYGFVRLQDSVWAYPYDCEDLVALVKAQFRLGADVLYLIVEQIERDTYLREHFGLPQR